MEKPPALPRRPRPALAGRARPLGRAAAACSTLARAGARMEAAPEAASALS